MHFSLNLSTQRSQDNPVVGRWPTTHEALGSTQLKKINKSKGETYTYTMQNIHSINQYFLNLLCARDLVSTFVVL